MLADTPRTWPNGPSISTLHVLLLFGGIPLLVIIGVSLMVLAPGWVRGPRYRPGQPWQARSAWFGPSLSADGATEASATGDHAAEGPDAPAAAVPSDQRRSPDSGGASAGW